MSRRNTTTALPVVRPTRRRRALRRAVFVAIHGTAATLAALELSHVTDGMVEAGAFLLALFISVVSVGLLTAACIDARPCRVCRWTVEGAAPECGWCGRPMNLHNSAWVCDRCDGHRHPHVDGDHRARA